MATIVVQTIVEAGIKPTKTTLHDDNVFDNDGNVFITYTNSVLPLVSRTLTFTAVTTSIEDPIYGSLTKGNIVVVVLHGETVFVGPFPPAIFNDSNGQVAMNISSRGAGDSALLLKLS